MSYPWTNGSAIPLDADAYVIAAEDLGCEVAAIRAIVEVESGRSWFLPDGSLVRRFEPHHMPGSTLTWRDSLKIRRWTREQMMRNAYDSAPEATCRASSFGGFQVMGFNHRDAGYSTSLSLVTDYNMSENAQLSSFVRLVQAWGIDGAIRSHDWYRFAKRYNGSGQPGVYAKKIEAAYRRHAGKASPVVLKVGARGPSVGRLQKALGIRVDNAFGPNTRRAVMDYQRDNGLKVDGIVGNSTWKVLEEKRDVKPKVQPTPTDGFIDRIVELGTKAGGGAAALEAVRTSLDPGAFTALSYGLVGIGVLVAALFIWRKFREG